MKKYLLSAAIITITFILGGCQQSVEHRIKQGFKNYVQTTFDNPKDLLEIVSISNIPDTVSAVQLANMVLSAEADIERILDENSKQRDSLMRVFNSSRLHTPNSVSESRRLEILQLSERMRLMKKKLEKRIEAYGQRQAVSNNVKEMLYAREYPIYYDFEIRARVKEDDKIKLKSYYAYTTNIDSLFTYRSDEFRYSDMSKDAEELCKESEKLLKMIHSEFDEDNEYIELLKEVLNVVVKK